MEESIYNAQEVENTLEKQKLSTLTKKMLQIKSLWHRGEENTLKPTSSPDILSAQTTTKPRFLESLRAELWHKKESGKWVVAPKLGFSLTQLTLF